VSRPEPGDRPAGRWRRAAGVALLLGLTLAPVVRWVGDDRHFRGELIRAQAEVAARWFAPARDRLARLVARRPTHDEALFQLGVCEDALGRPDAAVAAWAAVPATSPRAAEASVARARVLIYAFGRLGEAETLLEAALDGPKPVATSAFWTLAELLIWENRTGDARRLFEQGWKRGLAGDRVALLREHWRLERVDVTEDELSPILDAAAKHAPGDPRVALMRAAVATCYGRFDEAAKHLDACPDDPAAWSARLRLARAADRPKMAAQAIAHLPADHLTPRDVLSLRAWLAARRGDLAAERALLERLDALDPADTAALDRLSALAQEGGDTARAAAFRVRQAEASRLKEHYRWALIRLPAAPGRDALVDLARQAETLGRDFEARGWWTLAIAAAPADITPRDALDRLTRRERDHTLPPEARLDDLRADAAKVSQAKGASVRVSSPVHFDDSAAAAGLNAMYKAPPTPLCPIPEVMGGGMALLDYDGDGWLDVFVIQAGRFPPPPAFGPSRDRLFRNKRDGTFEDVSEQAGITSLPGGYGNAVTAGDFDNDGRPDLFLTRWGSYALWRNTGKGFEDVTGKAGLGGDRGWPTSAAFADLDGDGDLDLFVCQYLDWDVDHPPTCNSALVPGRVISCLPLGFPAQPDRLYRNDGGRFVDVSAAAGITAGDPNGRGLGVVAADLDGDGRLDLYVTNDQSANYLFRNLGGLKFEEVGFPSGAACAADGVFRAGMGIACGDADGDGRPDLVVGNFFGESLTFFRNLGSGLFVDQSNLSGLSAPSHFRLSFGTAFLDANNDGVLDLVTANGHVNDERPKAPFAMPPLFFLGAPHGRFSDLSAQVGPSWNRLLIGRGLAVGDLDNDGRIDVLIVPQNDPVVYAHNRTEGGHWLTLRLEGAPSNRDAVGARVTVTAGGRRMTGWRIGGGSYASASDPRLHFGLASATKVDAVEVTWPSGRVDRYKNLPSDMGYLLRESAARPEPLPGFTRWTPPVSAHDPRRR
jgi:enediyne biosynthesis protein E4